MIWGCGTDLTKSRVHYLGYSLINDGEDINIIESSDGLAYRVSALFVTSDSKHVVLVESDYEDIDVYD